MAVTVTDNNKALSSSKLDQKGLKDDSQTVKLLCALFTSIIIITSPSSHAVLCKCEQAWDVLHKSLVFSHAWLHYIHIPCSDGCFTCCNICIILESTCFPENVGVLFT